jgi:hypothetical protein
MYEYTANFHQHTTSSDGAAPHHEVIKAGTEANLDVMVFTDHNVYVPGIEGWYDETLALMGIEVNDTSLEPEINHYLCLGVDGDLNAYAADPQALIDAVNDGGGAGFIAHPFERPAPSFGEKAIPWLNWEVQGYTGLEIWNYMSEVKALLTGKVRAVRLAYSPDTFISAPFPETLAHWDKLTQNGQKVVAIGGSDAHGRTYNMGPLRRTIFPYPYLFSAIRTHLLLQEPLSKEPGQAKQQVLDTLRRGHCFVAYDLIGDTTGFRFTALSTEGQILFTSLYPENQTIQGGEISLGSLKLIQLAVTTPQRAEIHLLKDGAIVAQTRGQRLTHVASEVGVYRVECYKVHKTRWRGWIYSNPIYVRE